MESSGRGDSLLLGARMPLGKKEEWCKEENS